MQKECKGCMQQSSSLATRLVGSSHHDLRRTSRAAAAGRAARAAAAGALGGPRADPPAWAPCPNPTL